jgi:adenosylcobinamide-GDP ribazoletransferase
MKTFFKALIFAVQFLTRIPIPVAVQPQERIARCSLALFPLAGWLIGGILYFLCIALMLPGRFSPLTVAVFIVAAEALITGAFHLDGLADTFDAFFSTVHTPDQKLAIMKDSRIGVMGAVALVLALLLKTVLISECLRYNLKEVIAIYPVMGRLSQVALYRTCPYVRAGGIGLLFSKVATPGVFWCAAALALPSMLLQSPHQIAAYALYAAFLIYYRYHSSRHIGGITGDVLGSATVLSEIAFLAAFPFSMILQWFFLQLFLILTP